MRRGGWQGPGVEGEALEAAGFRGPLQPLQATMVFKAMRRLAQVIEKAR